MAKKRTSGIPFIAGFLMAGVVPAGIGLSGLREAVIATFFSQGVPGVIDRFECPRRSSNCQVIVTFAHPSGAQHEVVERNASPAPDFVAGSPVTVFVSRNDSGETIRINRPFYLWAMPSFIALISLPFLGVAAVLIADQVKHSIAGRSRARQRPSKS